MNPRIRTTGILALAAAILAPAFSIVMGYSPAVVVLSIVIVIGFFTIVFVGVMGSLENDPHPQSAKDSAAVNAWKARLGEAAETPETSESAN